MSFFRLPSLALVATGALLTAMLTACGGDSASGPPKIAQLQLSATPAEMETGSTIQIIATTLDGKGAVLTGRTVTWSSSSPAVATVENGIVTGVAPGQATITATAEGVSASKTITVVPVPVSAVLIDNRNPIVRQGEILQLAATTQDVIGRPLTGRTVTWSSANPTIATVSNTGLVVGVIAGSTYVRAESEGKLDSVVVRVRGLNAPTVTSASPATFVPGATATVTGTNFASDPTSNKVYVNGAAATVLAVTATTITFIVPSVQSLPCSPNGPVPLIVAVSGDSATGSANLNIATPRSLAVGQSLLLTTQADVACNEFSVTGGKYLVTAFNYATSPSVRTSFQLQGSSRSTAGSSVGLSAIAAVQSVVPVMGPVQQTIQPSDRAMSTHLATMELDRQLFARKGNPRRALVDQRDRARRGMSNVSPSARTAFASVSSGSVAAPVAPPQVGEMFWKRMFKTYGNYNTFDSVRVRVVYSGPKLVILEDSLNPLAGTLDAEYQRIGNEFDTQMFKYLSYFGNPLAVDSLTDNNGRVFAIFSKKVNEYTIGGSGGLLGFVTLCDFYPSTDPDPNFACPPSNLGEYFYAFVPNPGGTTGAFTIERWRGLVRSTLIHEMKHVVMFAERLSRDASFTEQSWLEEATAQQASELWSRDKYGSYGPRANINWAMGPQCDYAPQSATCPDPFEGIMHHFGFLYRHYAANESKSIISGADGGQPDFVVYGSSWSFARWVTDVYGGPDEAAFLRSLVQQQNDRGIQNVTARTGKTWEELMGYFSLASLADDYPGGTINDPRAQLPSWNTRDIFAQMSAHLVFRNADGTTTPAFPRPWPLNVRTPGFGNFPDVVRNVSQLPGGGFAAWEISGPQTAPQVLGIRATNGGLLSGNVGMAVVRIQ